MQNKVLAINNYFFNALWNTLHNRIIGLFFYDDTQCSESLIVASFWKAKQMQIIRIKITAFSLQVSELPSYISTLMIRGVIGIPISVLDLHI